MSEITGKSFSEPFKMRVVSGMLVRGSILVSWATGTKASSQLDWGFDPAVPYSTPEFHGTPAEMVRYHQVYFPTTYLDTEHFFRVRSRTASGKVGQSPVYSVIVPSKLRAGSDLAMTRFKLEIKPTAGWQVEQRLDLSGSFRADSEPEGTAVFSARTAAEDKPTQTAAAGSKNITTNYNLTIT